MNFTDDIMNTVFVMMKPALIAATFTAVFSLVLILSVWFYNKSRAVKEKSGVYFLIFLFGLIGAAVYWFTSRKKIGENDGLSSSDKRKYKVVSIVLLIVCVIGFAVNIFNSAQGKYYDDEFVGIIEEMSAGYYDKYGNEYEHQDDIIYYTRDGCQFKLKTDSNGNAEYRQMPETLTNKYRESYEPAFVYIDSDGYIVFFENGIQLDDSRMEDIFCYVDADGNYYAFPLEVYWNPDGTIKE